MSTINNGIRQNNIQDDTVPGLDPALYENIFNVSTINTDDGQSYYFYNTLNKIVIPENLDADSFENITLSYDTPWTTLSYKLYKDISLWWLIVLVNKPDYIFMAKAGQEYRFIKPTYVGGIIQEINKQLT